MFAQRRLKPFGLFALFLFFFFNFQVNFLGGVKWRQKNWLQCVFLDEKLKPKKIFGTCWQVLRVGITHTAALSFAFACGRGQRKRRKERLEERGVFKTKNKKKEK